MWARMACSARRARSSGSRVQSGSTWRSNRLKEALRAGAVRADRSDVLAHEECAANRARKVRCDGVSAPSSRCLLTTHPPSGRVRARIPRAWSCRGATRRRSIHTGLRHRRRPLNSHSILLSLPLTIRWVQSSSRRWMSSDIWLTPRRPLAVRCRPVPRPTTSPSFSAPRSVRQVRREVNLHGSVALSGCVPRGRGATAGRVRGVRVSRGTHG
jgi:hypothetical protein